MPSATALRDFHEHLLFLRAYPDSRSVLTRVERLLAGFARRADLARFRDELIDSGLAGTTMRYPFFYPTARWLAARFPRRLRLDWESFGEEDERELERLILTVLPPAESGWLRAGTVPLPAAVRNLAGRDRGRRSDATMLLSWVASAPGDDALHEALHDRAAPFYQLLPGPGVPSRTTARVPGSAVRFRDCAPHRARPDLAAELARPPLAIRDVCGRAARDLVTLARDAMVTRSRDLDCFSYADWRDVRRIELEDGLELIAFGTVPSRRLLLSSAYGLLTARNGVPVGYTQLDGYLASALVHFNTFETFRGADAAWVFARTLATARALFGAAAFAIEPYQLGDGNDEALDSGAWWFYFKLGFRPRDRATLRLAKREAARAAANRSYRSSRETLATLARRHLYWEPLAVAADVPPDAAASRAAARLLAGRSEEVGMARVAVVEEIRELLHAGSRPSFDANERLWLERWAPILLALPRFRRWSASEHRALLPLLRAKAGRRESALPALARAHPRFASALREIAAKALD